MSKEEIFKLDQPYAPRFQIICGRPIAFFIVNGEKVAYDVLYNEHGMIDLELTLQRKESLAQQMPKVLLDMKTEKQIQSNYYMQPMINASREEIEQREKDISDPWVPVIIVSVTNVRKSKSYKYTQ